MADTGKPNALFIVLEGIDGAGTTTQAKRLCQWLEAEGHRVEQTFEPTRGSVGSVIRDAIQAHSPDFDERVFALLFAADRVDHVQTCIAPAIEAGRFVVSDRYVMSSLAYQSVALDLGWVRELNRFATPPDITFLLDGPVEDCLARLDVAGRGGERYEKAQLLEQIRLNYQQIASTLAEEGQRIETLDATHSIDDLHGQIVDTVGSLIVRR